MREGRMSPVPSMTVARFWREAVLTRTVWLWRRWVSRGGGGASRRIGRLLHASEGRCGAAIIVWKAFAHRRLLRRAATEVALDHHNFKSHGLHFQRWRGGWSRMREAKQASHKAQAFALGRLMRHARVRHDGFHAAAHFTNGQRAFALRRWHYRALARKARRRGGEARPHGGRGSH